jgi:hypothetical protein
MSYVTFGAQTAIAGYSSLEAEFSTQPLLAEPTRANVHAQLTHVASGLEVVSAIAVGVLADADTRPVPPTRDTLQEVIAAARARLAQRRAQVDRDRSRAAVEYVMGLRARVAP